MQPGTQLGHYTVLSAIGRGGMGEVWKAKDTKLGREVAIKTLPIQFAQDQDRLTRFEREARLLAAVNHPNIASIYGLEDHAASRFLVLELVDGETLADQIKRGPIPVEKSLKLALQIADALEAAHEKGVIHRDLKPSNIKITPEGKVKVLDFGLAKAFTEGEGPVNVSNSPTLSLQATQQGVILGTAAYMSPEQARGEAVDSRADIWAFGAVLFEMLTGHRTFEGKTVTDILASVLKSEPVWSSLPPNLHPRIRYLIERCLEKEPESRCQTITEGRMDIQKALADPRGVSPEPTSAISGARRSSKVLWLAAIAATAIVAVLAGWNLKPVPAPTPDLTSRFPLVLPRGQTFSNTAGRVTDISPDGSRIVYVANGQLYVRELNQLESSPVRGTLESPALPVFSPDGQSLAYITLSGNFPIKRVPVTGGTPVTIRQGNGPISELEWDASDEILFPQAEGILSIPANGGLDKVLVQAEKGEILSSPSRLPDGKGLLFVSAKTASAAGWDEARILLQTAAGRKLIFEGGSAARYVPTGHIVYAQANTLFVMPFDLETLQARAGPVPVVEGTLRASQNLTDTAQFAVSDNGTLVHLTGTGATSSTMRSLAWVDRKGNEHALNVRADDYRYARISPDGKRVALVIAGTDGNWDIWVLDLATGNLNKLTFDAAVDANPMWSPAGDQIFFRSDRSGSPALYSIPPEGGEARLVTAPKGFAALPWSMTRDGKTLAVVAVYSVVRTGIQTLSMSSPSEFQKLLDDASGYVYNEPMISPNGAWLAYLEGPLTSPQISVRPFPDVAQKQVTVSAPKFGNNPVWSADGSELFYLGWPNSDGIWAAPVQYAPFRIGTPQLLFRRPYRYGAMADAGQGGRAWDVDPNGKGFLMITLPGAAAGDKTVEADEPQIRVVLNWFKELKERVKVP